MHFVHIVTSSRALSRETTLIIHQTKRSIDSLGQYLAHYNLI